MKNQILLLVSLIIIAMPVFGQNHCDSVLLFAGREMRSRSTELERKSYIYNEICGGKYRSSQGSARAKLNTIINTVPIGFDFGGTNNTERIENWCQANANLQEEKFSHLEIHETVFAPAIGAWETCQKLNSGGTIIESTFVDEKSPLFIVKNGLSGGQVLEIRGLSVSNSSMSCNVVTDSTKVTAKSDLAIERLVVTSGRNANIECFRKTEKSIINGTEHEILPEVTLTMLFSDSNFQLKFPAQKGFMVTETQMSELMLRIEKLEKSSVKVEEDCLTTDEEQICWGTIPINSSQGHVASFNFVFSKPFAAPPAITYGINVGGAGGRFLGVYDFTSSAKGFSGGLTHQGSAGQAVPTGTMSYVAIGKRAK